MYLLILLLLLLSFFVKIIVINNCSVNESQSQTAQSAVYDKSATNGQTQVRLWFNQLFDLGMEQPSGSHLWNTYIKSGRHSSGDWIDEIL